LEEFFCGVLFKTRYTSSSVEGSDKITIQNVCDANSRVWLSFICVDQVSKKIIIIVRHLLALPLTTAEACMIVCRDVVEVSMQCCNCHYSMDRKTRKSLMKKSLTRMTRKGLTMKKMKKMRMNLMKMRRKKKNQMTMQVNS